MMLGPPVTAPTTPPTTAPGGPAMTAPVPAPIATPSRVPACAAIGAATRASVKNAAFMNDFIEISLGCLIDYEGKSAHAEWFRWRNGRRHRLLKSKGCC